MTERTSGVPAPDSPILADQAAQWRSAYIHVPFCRRRCPYCDFAVVTEDEGGVEPAIGRYVEAVVAEIERSEPWGPLDAVNIGGGTPSTLASRSLGAFLEALDDRFGLAPGAEIGLEANPEDWSVEYAKQLVAIGFTRVSFGVQSFDPAVLRALGRLHTPDQSVEAVVQAREAGFASINVDLIYGSPTESAASWAATVGATLDLDIDHLSAYSLTVERGTELSRAVLAGAAAPDPDRQADAWEHLADLAPGAGLVRYEVSNYAAVGHACRYNLGTWAQGEYLGFGLGAHAHRSGVRTRNVRRLDRYIEAVEAGRRPEAGRQTASDHEREIERLFVGLRRSAGVVPGELGRRLLESSEGRRLVAAGVVADIDGRLVVKRPLLTDEVVRAVLSLSP